MNTRLVKVLGGGGLRVRPGQWIEAGSAVGISPDRVEEVRSPVTGIVKEVWPSRCGGLLEVVLEHRREYDDLEDL